MGIFGSGPSDDGSIFRTTANTQFNSFQNPLPTLNMSGPGWGVDQSSLTPSYAALYRPGNQEDPITSARPGFWASAHNQFNPFAGRGYGPWQDPFLAQQQYRENLFPKASHAAMWAAQNLGVGTAAFWLSSQGLSYAAKTYGYSSSTAAFAQAGEGLFGGFARGVLGPNLGASNIGRGVIGGSSLLGKGLGAGFGMFGAQMYLAQKAVDAADAGIFDPYAQQFRTGRHFRENFSGVTFAGGGYGNPYTGRGLSFSSSTAIAGDVTRSGFSNWSMSGKDITGISDIAGRMGLLDNVNPAQFAKQITAITKQVAMIAAVANDPDYKNSLEIISKLKDAGLSVNKAGSFMSALGGNSSIAGISVKRMMELGTQAQFLFGANGLTPYIGQEVHAQSMASFAAASRNGLVSPALLARMGGVSGATQSALTGMINAAQTPYNQIMLSNQYMFGTGGTTGNIVGDLSKFGQSFVKNPVSAWGAMQLHAGAMTSAQMSTMGILATHQEWKNRARMLGLLNSDDTMDDSVAMSMGLSQGLDRSQAEAITVQLRNARDPAQYHNMVSGMKSQYLKDRATMMNSTGADSLLPITQVKSLARTAGTNWKGYLHEQVVHPISQVVGDISDWGSGFVDMANYGNNSAIDSSGRVRIQDLGKIRNKQPDKNTLMGWYQNSWVGRRFSGELPDETGMDTYNRFWNDLEEGGVSDTEIIDAFMSDKKGVNSRSADKMQKILKTRSRKAIYDMLENSKSVQAFMKSNYRTYEEFSSATQNGKGLRLTLTGEGTGKFDYLPGHGDKRIDATGNIDAIDKTKDMIEGLKKELDRVRTLNRESSVVSSSYTESVNARANLESADMNLKASENNMKASKQLLEFADKEINKTGGGSKFNISYSYSTPREAGK